MLDPSLIYGSMDVRDEHSDLRLDVDNMSYEVIVLVCSQHFSVLCSVDSSDKFPSCDYPIGYQMQELLALGESIGDVNTGLSNEIICTCLSESKYSPLDATLASLSADSDVKCSICQVCMQWP